MEAQETTPSLGDPPIEPPPADWLGPVEDIDEDFEEEENGGDQGLNEGDPEKADSGTDVLKRTHRDGLYVAALIRPSLANLILFLWALISREPRCTSASAATLEIFSHLCLRSP